MRGTRLEGNTALYVLHQLVDEERITARLTGNGLRARRRGFVLGIEQRDSQLATLLGRQRLHRQFVMHQPAQFLDLSQCAQTGTALRILAAITENEQEYRRVGRAQEIGQQGGAVLVSPLHIIDDQHERASIAEARQQFAQSGQRATTNLLRIRHLDGAPRDACDRIETAQDGEDARQRGQIARPQRLGFRSRQTLQVMAQGIDQAVQRLVGHGFLLVTTSAKNHRLALVAQVVEKALHQGALARPGSALHLDQHGSARACFLACLRQQIQVALPADQGDFQTLRVCWPTRSVNRNVVAPRWLHERQPP